ncbi:MAG: glycosyltransferase family 2 protein [Fischerella sp.]|jgi:glycosyltransferase involved in cell wall biosynthesis|uniref:hormogonium polysaccharide biosynthesis glycosyltransferase HpsE n=1 Tax=Fischerella sp. TaxID=1191 RepID=UPI0017A403A7|nr:hormogonium polysaccharide biosynthesis glycosyltransferase HpsE [Fischerella sp.]NWF58002.1 glycosyltransferase family 2 protein [Fischerella sp.]
MINNRVLDLIESQSLDFTLAIPTYNGGKLLPRLLEKLCSQTGVEDLKWEIIIVDNNSTDNTAAVIRHYQSNWQINCQLRYFLETKQGAAFARLRAVSEAKGELIGFLDDDNLPASDWIAQAVAFAKEYPYAGAFGGQIHGDFEIQPPENFARIQSFLAIRERGDKPNLYDPINLSLPPAAAIVIRRKIWRDRVPSRPFLTGKVPGKMVQGDDYEPLLYIHKAGWEIWYNPAMHTYHQIPHWRLKNYYLLSLARGCGLCICHLRLINAQNWQKPIIFLRIILGNLRRLLQHIIKYRRQLRNDAIALVEMEFYLSSMLSPFYFLKTLIWK